MTWNPLEGVSTLRHAFRVARDLTSAAPERGETEYWYSLATKTVGSLLMLAFQSSRDIFDVARAIESREFDTWLDVVGHSEAGEVLETFLSRDHRTIDGVLTTAETMLMPWRFRQPLARVRSVIEGPNTLYLCSPRADQRHYEPLFRGALRMVLEEQQRRMELGTQRRLLLVLDEAATVASLDELDQMAATVSGLNVTLVTVVQDFSQLKARWGARASTIVNNHTTRLVLGGLADPTASHLVLPELFETRKDAPPSVPLRQRPPGTGTVIAGHRSDLCACDLQPWWNVAVAREVLRVRGRADPSRPLSPLSIY